jgi:hypothetical protein
MQREVIPAHAVCRRAGVRPVVTVNFTVAIDLAAKPGIIPVVDQRENVFLANNVLKSLAKRQCDHPSAGGNRMRPHADNEIAVIRKTVLDGAVVFVVRC